LAKVVSLTPSICVMRAPERHRQQLDEAELGAGLQALGAVGALARLVEAHRTASSRPNSRKA
jgi:hypothetical protein